MSAIAHGQQQESTVALDQTISLSGVTAYDPEELLSFVGNLLFQQGKPLTAEEISLVVQQIYLEDGYILAEVYVDREGRAVSVYEGVISDVSIEGVDERTFALLQKYVTPVVGTPAINQREVERAVMLANDLGTISVTSEITYPDPSRGALLRLIAEPQETSSTVVTLDNPAGRFGEALTLSFEQQFFGLATPGDLLRFDLAVSREFDVSDTDYYGAIAYRFPVGGAGSYIEAYSANAVADRDARGGRSVTEIDGATYILAYGTPIIRDVERYGYLIAEARHSQSDTRVGTARFDSSVDAISLSWLFGRALQSGVSYEYGVDVSFGTQDPPNNGLDNGDTNFGYVRFGLGADVPVPQLAPHTSVSFEVWGQWSPDRLPITEEFYIGGRERERGFSFAEATGDNGISLSVEIGRDFFPQSESVQRLRPFTFFDVGWIENNSPSVFEVNDTTLASLGVGLDTQFSQGVFLRTHLSVPLRDGPQTDKSEPVFYMSMSKSW